MLIQAEADSKIFIIFESEEIKEKREEKRRIFVLGGTKIYVK